MLTRILQLKGLGAIYLKALIKDIYMKKEDQQDATIRCLLLTSVSTCFGHHYAHLQENKGTVTAFGVLFCNKRENVDISRDFFTTKKDVTANIYAFQLVTEQHTKCSNSAFVLLKMGIMMPETC